MTNPKKNRKVFNIILAIVLAVGVWLYVINVENPTGTVPIRDIPVSLVGEDSLAERGLMVTDQSRDSVNLKLSGRRKTLMKLNRKNLTLELDVSTITSEGEHTISCRASFPNNIGTDNVSVSDWEDLRVTVTVEKQETKEIPVRGEFIGTEAENCLAGAVSTDPETITLTGPAEALDGVSYALATIGGKEVSDTITQQTGLAEKHHPGPGDRRRHRPGPPSGGPALDRDPHRGRHDLGRGCNGRHFPQEPHRRERGRGRPAPIHFPGGDRPEQRPGRHFVCASHPPAGRRGGLGTRGPLCHREPLL